MRVRICYTVEVDDEYRRALNSYFGCKGLASRDDIKRWFEDNGSSCDADMLDEWKRRNEPTPCE